MEQIKFIHAADLHLDSPFLGLGHLPRSIYDEVKESTFLALNNLVDLAISEQVDFVLLVGDLFDNEKQSIKAQMKLRDAFFKLQKVNIQVYLSYGNHDFLNGNKYKIEFPGNVHWFSSEQVQHFSYEKDGMILANIHGFSYENRAVTESKMDEYIIDSQGITPFHIAMLHGSAGGSDVHDHYAPFQISALKQKNFDYWALGHIHKREILSETPPIIYPGNIQGRHRNESGSKGCYLVELNKTGCELTYFSLAKIEFTNLSIDIREIEKIEAITELINKGLTHLTKNKHHLITLEIIVKVEWWGKYQCEILEIIEWLNEQQVGMHDDWIFIYNIKARPLMETELISNHSFIGEILEQMEHLTIDKISSDFTAHPVGRKYAKELVQEIRDEEIIEAAKQLLLTELVYKRG